MDRAHFLVFLAFVLIPAMTLRAATGHGGARIAGIANAGVAIHDPWAVNYNQAGMVHCDHAMAALYTENRFMLADISLASAAVILPVTYGTLGVSLGTFGNEHYREGNAGLAFARRFGERFSAGVRLNYHFVSVGEGYGSAGTLTAEGGGIFELAPGLHIGAHVVNPTGSVIARPEYIAHDERVTTVFRTGISYRFSDNGLLTLEIEHERHVSPPSARVGLEYGIGEYLFVRCGAGIHPIHNAAGFGYRSGRWQIDIASSYHYVLGYSPMAGLIYHFGDSQRKRSGIQPGQ